MGEFVQQIKENWQSLLLLVIAFVVLAWGDIAYTLTTQEKIDRLQSNICLVIRESGKNTATQQAFYESAAARARVRARLEKGPSRQIDLDSYRNLNHIASQYRQSASFKFPGC